MGSPRCGHAVGSEGTFILTSGMMVFRSGDAERRAKVAARRAAERVPI